MRSLIPGLLLATLGCAPAAPPPTAFEVTDPDGAPAELFKDGVTVAIFTRTDCPLANRAAPEIRELCARFQPRGVEFNLVYVDPRETGEAIRKHLKDYDYPCPALRDPKHSLVAHCGATATPEAVVFDKARAIVYRGRINDAYAEVGRPQTVTTRDLADAIAAVLAGKAVAVPRTPVHGCPIADLKK